MDLQALLIEHNVFANLLYNVKILSLKDKMLNDNISQFANEIIFKASV